MSILTPERPIEDELDQPASEAASVDERPPGDDVLDASADDDAPVSVLLTSAAAFLAAAAAGWMCAGIFRGTFPRLAGLLGPAVGVGMIALSYRTRRPSFVQYLALPACMVAGALLVLPDATGGSANLPGLVAEAIRSGGLGQPPVAFDPGWRFLLVTLTGLIGAGAASIGIALNKPKTGILLPVPLIFGAALVQPAGATMVSTLVALVLGIGGMAVAFGADLAREGATSGNFEARRLGRGAALLALLVAVLVGLSQLGFLFPDAEDDQVIPPKRPENPPAAKDRELFTVASPVQVPWRLGTLDVYQDNAWMTPPFDSGRLVPITGTRIPFVGNAEHAEESTVPKAPSSASGETFTATFRVSDIEGNVVPVVMTPVAVPSSDVSIEYDPRTQAFRLPGGRPRRGATYKVTAPMPPGAEELKASPEPGAHVREFLQVPAPPDAVAQLLVQAPTENPFDRLQFVRNAFYQSVVAAGAGAPVDVPPTRVVDMLEGGEGTPYEITAGEVLLARWAGIPARIGYGYYGGEQVAGAAEPTFSIRPNQGATWLEAYFEGHGWVPIVGTPPKAKSSINDNEKKDDPTIRPTEELALLVYVPVRLQSIQLLYEIVRYWVFRAFPIAVVGLLAFLFFPGAVKMARGVLRRRWARAHGPRGRIMVAYTEFRDAVNDFNFGDPIHSPLEFLGDIAPDREHTELAWLVTRGLWGDLLRDLRPEDAQAAEELAASVTRRVRRANSGLPRIIAFGSRASLRDPYTYEVPNLWRSWRPVAAIRRAAGRANPLRLRRVVARLWRRGAPRTAMLVLLASMFLGGCVQRIDLEARATSGLPEPVAPASLGEFAFVREEAAEKAYADAGDDALVEPGRVFSIHQGDDIQGSFQMAVFKPGVLDRRDDLQRGVLEDLGGGRFELTRIGTERVYALRTPEQRMLLWFPASGRYFALMVARREFEGADDLFVRLLAFHRGESPDEVDTTARAPHDTRRGVRDE